MKKNIFLMSFYPHYVSSVEHDQCINRADTLPVASKISSKNNLIPYAVYDRFMSKNAHKISLSCLRGSFKNSEISDLWISKPQ